MKRILAALSVLALAACASVPIAPHAAPKTPPHKVGAEIGTYPNATTLGGGERLVGDQSAVTVNITPVQIGRYVLNSANQSQLPTLVTGDCLSNNGTTLIWTASCGGGGGGGGFNLVTSGTNTSAAMGVGTGASLFTTGSGTIAATTTVALANAPTQCTVAGQFATGVNAAGNANCATPAGGGNVTNSGTPTSGQLTTWTAATVIAGTTIGSNTVVCNAGSGIAACTPATTLGVLNSGSANAQVGTSYTLILADANNEVTMSNSSANALTIPPNSSVAFPIGTIVVLEQLGTGTTTITLGAGVSVQSPGNITTDSLGGQYGFIELEQVATNVWAVLALVPGDIKFTLGGTCTNSANSGGNTGGTITMSSAGNCTIIVTPGGGIHANNLWVGSMSDRTQPTVPMWGETASSATAITFTVPTAVASSDVLTFSMTPQ